MRPEERLLSACARLRPTGEAAALLGEGLDLDLALARAAESRLLPLLHWQGLPWPEPFRARLREAYVRSAAAAVAQDGLRDLVWGALASRGARAVLLKGAALRLAVYPDPAIRPMADLDLWVPPDDVAVADLAMADAGLRRRDPPGAWHAMRRFGCEAAYLGADGRLAVEIHWALRQYERYRGILEIPPDRIWAESRAEGPFRCLPLWLEPLHLAFHAGAVHGFRGTLWMVDLHAWMRRHSPDWDQVLEEGRRLGSLRALAWAAHLLGRTHDVAMPPSVARTLARRLCGEEAWAFRGRSLLHGAAEYTVPHGWARVRPLMALDGWGPRARAAGRGLVGSRGRRLWRQALAVSM